MEREKVIDSHAYFRLYPEKTTPCIYGLHKIYREGDPLRPISSSTNSVTYKIAKHLITILASLVENTSHHVQNSADFTNKVQNFKSLLYMEKVESRALSSFKGTTPSHRFRYVDNTWVKIKTQEVEAFTDHTNSVDSNIKFTKGRCQREQAAILGLCCVDRGGR